jgi:hypothetical protein
MTFDNWLTPAFGCWVIGSGPTDELLVGVETNVTPDAGVSAIIGFVGACWVVPSCVVDVEDVELVELFKIGCWNWDAWSEEQTQQQHYQELVEA